MLMLQVKRVSRIAILDIAVPGCRFNGGMFNRDLAGISSEITMNAQRILCLNRVATRDTTCRVPRPISIAALFHGCWHPRNRHERLRYLIEQLACILFFAQ